MLPISFIVVPSLPIWQFSIGPYYYVQVQVTIFQKQGLFSSLKIDKKGWSSRFMKLYKPLQARYRFMNIWEKVTGWVKYLWELNMAHNIFKARTIDRPRKHSNPKVKKITCDQNHNNCLVHAKSLPREMSNWFSFASQHWSIIHFLLTPKQC
jgi:hypothetical protein